MSKAEFENSSQKAESWKDKKESAEKARAQFEFAQTVQADLKSFRNSEGASKVDKALLKRLVDSLLPILKQRGATEATEEQMEELKRVLGQITESLKSAKETSENTEDQNKKDKEEKNGDRFEGRGDSESKESETDRFKEQFEQFEAMRNEHDVERATGSQWYLSNVTGINEDLDYAKIFDYFTYQTPSNFRNKTHHLVERQINLQKEIQNFITQLEQQADSGDRLLKVSKEKFSSFQTMVRLLQKFKNQFKAQNYNQKTEAYKAFAEYADAAEQYAQQKTEAQQHAKESEATTSDNEAEHPASQEESSSDEGKEASSAENGKEQTAWEDRSDKWKEKFKRRGAADLVKQIDLLQKLINEYRNRKGVSFTHKEASIFLDGYATSKLNLGQLKKQVNRRLEDGLNDDDYAFIYEKRAHIARYLMELRETMRNLEKKSDPDDPEPDPDPEPDNPDDPEPDPDPEPDNPDDPEPDEPGRHISKELLANREQFREQFNAMRAAKREYLRLKELSQLYKKDKGSEHAEGGHVNSVHEQLAEAKNNYLEAAGSYYQALSGAVENGNEKRFPDDPASGTVTEAVRAMSAKHLIERTVRQETAIEAGALDRKRNGVLAKVASVFNKPRSAKTKTAFKWAARVGVLTAAGVATYATAGLAPALLAVGTTGGFMGGKIVATEAFNKVGFTAGAVGVKMLTFIGAGAVVGGVAGEAVADNRYKANRAKYETANTKAGQTLGSETIAALYEEVSKTGSATFKWDRNKKIWKVRGALIGGAAGGVAGLFIGDDGEVPDGGGFEAPDSTVDAGDRPVVEEPDVAEVPPTSTFTSAPEVSETELEPAAPEPVPEPTLEPRFREVTEMMTEDREVEHVLSREAFGAMEGDTTYELPHNGDYSLWNIAEGDMANGSKGEVRIPQPEAFALAEEKGQLQQLIATVVKEIERNPEARQALGMKVDGNPNEWLHAGREFNVDAYDRLARIVGVEKGILNESVLTVNAPVAEVTDSISHISEADPLPSTEPIEPTRPVARPENLTATTGPDTEAPRAAGLPEDESPPTSTPEPIPDVTGLASDVPPSGGSVESTDVISAGSLENNLQAVREGGMTAQEFARAYGIENVNAQLVDGKLQLQVISGALEGGERLVSGLENIDNINKLTIASDGTVTFEGNLRNWETLVPGFTGQVSPVEKLQLTESTVQASNPSAVERAYFPGITGQFIDRLAVNEKVQTLQFDRTTGELEKVVGVSGQEIDLNFNPLTDGVREKFTFPESLSSEADVESGLEASTAATEQTNEALSANELTKALQASVDPTILGTFESWSPAFQQQLLSELEQRQQAYEMQQNEPLPTADSEKLFETMVMREQLLDKLSDYFTNVNESASMVDLREYLNTTTTPLLEAVTSMTETVREFVSLLNIQGILQVGRTLQESLEAAIADGRLELTEEGIKTARPGVIRDNVIHYNFDQGGP